MPAITPPVTTEDDAADHLQKLIRERFEIMTNFADMDRQAQELTKIFRKFDLDDSGSLTFEEFEKLLVEIKCNHVRESSRHALFDRYDDDLNGHLNLKELKDGARFERALWMLIATVLYYPVIQATLPIIHCASYKLDRLWDASQGEWVDDPNQIVGGSNSTETESRLNNDMSQLCYTPEHKVSFMVAVIVLGLCFVTPFIAMYQIKKSKKQNREILDQQDEKEDREVVAKKKDYMK